MTKTAAAACAMAAVAFAQNRDTLETKLTAKGTQVVLEWSKKHPWDANLLARGASLVVSYRVAEGGPVKEDCLLGAPQYPTPSTRRGVRGMTGAPCQGIPGAVSGKKEDRELRFTLPAQLTDAPAGPVCLYIRTGEGRPLPLRKVESGVDTARFRVEGWERGVAAQARRAELTAEIARLEKESEITAGNIRKLEAANAEKGWRDDAACQALRTPKLAMESSGRPVAPPEQHASFARQVCILRASNAELMVRAIVAKGLAEGKLKGSEESERFLVSLQFGSVVGPQVLHALLGLIGEADRAPFTARMGQLKEFTRDWEQFAPLVDAYKKRYPVPHFGRPGEMLSLQDEAEKAGAHLAKSIAGGGIDAVASRGFAGAMLEAYTRCVQDGQNQLATTYRSAVELEQRTPALQAQVERELQRTCKMGLAAEESERRKLAAFTQSLNEARARLGELAATAENIATGERLLNTVSCVP